MTSLAKITPDSQDDAAMKPIRVVICGEVNSGKSTVVNAILKGRVLPDLFGGKTRPFIHIRSGDADALTARYAGGKETALDAMTSDALQEAEACEFVSGADQLAGFEFIEMPFLNERTLSDDEIAFVEAADIIVWTTIASQAWRLSEKSILDRCERRPEAAVLVVSRADKLRSKADREKLLSRMERETGDYFREIVMMHGKDSIVEAAGTDAAKWETTGAPELLGHLERLSVEVREKQAAALSAVEELAESQFDAAEDADEEPAPVSTANVVPLARPTQVAEPVVEPEPVAEAEPDTHAEAGLGALADAVAMAKGKVVAPVTVEADTPTEPEAEVEETPEPVVEAEPIEAQAVEEPAFTEIPDEPKVPSSARAKIAELLPVMHGCSAVGFAPLGNESETEFLKGDAATWSEIGPACRNMYAADAKLDPQTAGEPILSHVTLRSHQFLTQSYPRKGVVLFMIAPTARMNHALARTAFQRLSRTLEQAR